MSGQRGGCLSILFSWAACSGGLSQAGRREHSRVFGEGIYPFPALSLSMVSSSLLLQAAALVNLLFQTYLCRGFSWFCVLKFLLTSFWGWETPKTPLKDKGANTFPYLFVNTSDFASV